MLKSRLDCDYESRFFGQAGNICDELDLEENDKKSVTQEGHLIYGKTVNYRLRKSFP